MAEDAKRRELIEAVVADVFDQHVRALHDDVVGRVLSTLETLDEKKPERPVSQWLRSAIDGIESSGQQTDILKALLDGTAQFCERAAILVLRGATAVMWQGRGFADGESLRTVSVDLNAGPCAVAIHDRISAPALSNEVHGRFSQEGNRPCVVIPLFVREKVAALLYCDTTSQAEALDTLAIELLATAAGRWIELQAFRKNAGMPAPAPKPAAAPLSSQRTITAKADPQAHAAAAAVSNAAHGAVHHVHASPVNATSSDSEHQRSHLTDVADDRMPPGDQELHRKARRFAKLLVDEIILYNREKVSEGRRNHDIYDRLKDDIDKSRATYEKRYGDSSVTKFDYFRHAVVSGLAEHNIALLGSNFPR